MTGAMGVATFAMFAFTDVSGAWAVDDSANDTPVSLASAAEAGVQIASDIAHISQQAPGAPNFVEVPVVQPVAEPAVETAVDGAGDPDETPASLRELVDMQGVPGSLDSEMNCLAGAIYFESKGESLAGQLAVGRVVVARTQSGRFPDSYCGVVFQRSQFSFVRGGAMPWINKDSASWKTAVRVAQIAASGSWDSPVEGALFFHARRVSPGWRLTRLAQVDNHVFYR